MKNTCKISQHVLRLQFQPKGWPLALGRTFIDRIPEDHEVAEILAQKSTEPCLEIGTISTVRALFYKNKSGALGIVSVISPGPLSCSTFAVARECPTRVHPQTPHANHFRMPAINACELSGVSKDRGWGSIGYPEKKNFTTWHLGSSMPEATQGVYICGCFCMRIPSVGVDLNGHQRESHNSHEGSLIRETPMRPAPLLRHPHQGPNDLSDPQNYGKELGVCHFFRWTPKWWVFLVAFL